jgi:hypothetical protein
MNVEALTFQQIVDANFDQAIYTASPNNTINVVQIAAKGSGTNIGLALSPKGNGFISARVPDGTAANGNTRGQHAVDLQLRRDNAGLVASGSYSCIIGGYNCTASGEGAVAGSRSCTASGTYSIAIGGNCNATGYGDVALGDQCAATGIVSFSSGSLGSSYLRGMRSHGSGQSNSFGQEILIHCSNTTTSNTRVVLLTPTAQTALSIRSGKYVNALVYINGSKTDGSSTAVYVRKVAIRRVSNTTVLLGSVDTIGTDVASGTSIDIVANDTNDSLEIGVIGIAGETWRWSGMIHGLEATF